MLARRPRRLVVPAELRESVASRVRDAHPAEIGGFLCCERRDDSLWATDHVPLDNESSEPRRRFRATIPPEEPPTPRVFYHSHTSPSAPSGLTRTDRANIQDSLALVVFAPHGRPHSYRLFRRGLFNWQELPVELAADEAESRLPRLL